MRITSLKLTNFRNWENISFEFADRVLFYGPNALGKTNILEALYVLATTRSFRGRDAEVLKFGSDFSVVTGEIEKEGKNFSAEAIYRKEGARVEKTFKINDKTRPTIDFVGEFSAIVFSPEDLGLISGPPENKRRYMSFTIGQKDREYLFDLLNYKKVLKQRNELLKKCDLGTIKEEIDVWDRALSENGQKVIEKRKKLEEFINKRLNKYYQELSGEYKSLYFNYVPALWGDDLSASLSNARERDIREKNTNFGPHRDSWEIESDLGIVSRFASRGELRTMLLALKLCERDFFVAQGKEMPVILLDDVFSELDETRRKYLVDAFSGCQLVITTTDLEHLDPSLQIGTQIVNVENIRRVPHQASFQTENVGSEAEEALRG